MEDKKYLDLEGLKEYHKLLLNLNEKEKEELLNLISNKLEIGKLGTTEGE